MHSIEQVTSTRAAELLPQLCDLLIDSVQGGASVGFLPPLSRDHAESYWRGVIEQLESPHRILIVALVHTVLVGAVQLQLVDKANARHRAEVQKLMVHSRFRRHGFARALMQTVESTARSLQRALLVLDTRHGDAAEKLYLSLGYRMAGLIPNYAASADGQFHTTSFLYRQLADPLVASAR